MKAAVCREFGQPLVVEELEIDPPARHEVGVRVGACAICHSDIHAMEGAWGGTLPVVYGHEAAGVVESLGDGVTRLAIGDHVVVTLMRSCGACYYCAQGETHVCDAHFALASENRLHRADGATVHQGIKTGAFAERVVVHESQAIAIPREVPLDSASLLACGVITGLGAVVNTARMPQGSSAVVIGTGGVGLNSVQGAVLSGAGRIVAVDVSEDKLESAKAFGATDAVDAGRDDVADFVRARTGGRGADYVFVTVGAVAAIEQGLGLLRPGGTLVVVGMPASGAMAAFEAVEFADASLRILGSKMGSTRPSIDIPRLVDLYRQGRLKLDELITRRYPLADINEAVAAVNRGEALRNVVTM